MPISLKTMEPTPIRTSAPTRFRRAASPRDSEALLREISTLVAERQQLRARGTTSMRLERNRLRIARAQWELSYALIQRYLPAQAANAA
jgi:hypothetical protein